MVIYYVNPDAQYKDIRLNGIIKEPLQFNGEYDVPDELAQRLISTSFWSESVVTEDVAIENNDNDVENEE